jgi:hypothetical protein
MTGINDVRYTGQTDTGQLSFSFHTERAAVRTVAG